MRALRRLFFLLLVAAVVAVAVAMSPFTHRTVALRYLRKYFHDVRLERLFVGPNVIKINGLSLAKDSLEFMVSHCTIEWSLKDMIFLKELKIRSIKSDDIFLSYRKCEEDAKKWKPMSFNEGYNKFREKVIAASTMPKFISMPRVTVDRIELRGLIDFQEFIFADVAIEGGGLTPLGTAIVDINADVGIEMEQPLDMKVTVQMKIFQSAEAVLSDIEFRARCNVSNQTERPSKELAIDFTAKIDSDGSSHHLSVGFSEMDPLCFADVRFSREAKSLSVEYVHDIYWSDFTEILQNRNFPEFETEARIGGEFDLNDLDGILKISGRVAVGNGFAVMLLPSLKSDLSFAVESTLKMDKGTMSIGSLSSICNSGDGAVKILCRQANPVIIWSQNAGFLIGKNIRDAGKDLAKIEVVNFNPQFAVDSSAATKLDALVSGQFNVSSKGGVFTVKSCENCPFDLKKCSIFKKGKKCGAVDVSCFATVDLGETLRATFDDISIVSLDGEPIFVGSVAFSSAAAKCEYTAECEAVCQLSNLCKLPVLSGMTTAKSGVCSGYAEIAGTNGLINGKSELKLKGLLCEGQSTPLNGECAIDFSHTPDTVAVNVGLNLFGMHTTSADLAVETSGNAAGGTEEVKFELKGDSISVEDLKNVFAVPFGDSKINGSGSYAKVERLLPMDNDSTILVPVMQPPQAAWAGVKVRGIIDVAKVFVAESMVIDKLECCCIVDDDKIDLKTLGFRLAESPFNLEAKLEYAKDNGEDPYIFSLHSTFASENIGKICKLMDKSSSAAMDGSCEASLWLNSEGSDPMEAIKKVQGKLDMRCESGMIRPMRFLDKRNVAIVDAIGVVGTLPIGVGSRFRPAGALVDRLQSIDYDFIMVSAKRGQNLDIILDECTMVGPEILVKVDGEVPYEKNKSFMSLPIVIALDVGVDGSLGESFNALGLVRDKLPNEQYVHCPKFFIKGTIAKPDFSDFLKIFSSPRGNFRF
ncbi:MAG: hypothetical protein LBI61_00600 [Puniceicoccales bacterium]|jgi:hypothetical protein|nr:hypothetical protein [Puniceicoccales bacterium]